MQAKFKNIPARLHVLLARNASTAVVIRRGPTKRTAVIGWDRKTDQFRLGQWLSGRIYERRSDLSPDGKLLIYFALNGRWETTVKGSWTAISRAPYLKAISLFAKGDTWHGGGLFLTDGHYWLNDGYGHKVVHQDPSLQRRTDYPWHAYDGGLYFIRLQRDGWTLTATDLDSTGEGIVRFERRINDNWLLRKLVHATSNCLVGRGYDFDTYELASTASQQVLSKPNWEWADVDGTRLLWASEGCLYAGQAVAVGLQNEQLLYDFNCMKFERVAAPY